MEDDLYVGVWENFYKNNELRVDCLREYLGDPYLCVRVLLGASVIFSSRKVSEENVTQLIESLEKRGVTAIKEQLIR